MPHCLYRYSTVCLFPLHFVTCNSLGRLFASPAVLLSHLYNVIYTSLLENAYLQIRESHPLLAIMLQYHLQEGGPHFFSVLFLQPQTLGDKLKGQKNGRLQIHNLKVSPINLINASECHS